MTLKDYLEARGETAVAFALRAKLRPTTVYGVLKGTMPRADTADKIVKASKREPTRNGGTVTLSALAGNRED